MYGTAINNRFIDETVEALRDGHIIIYPTDSLYAIGCDALNNRAIEKICRLKGIDPKKHPLSIACADLSQAASYARIDNRAFALMRGNLPGPFTFILPAAPSLPKIFKGRREVGVRIPDDTIARELAGRLGNPLLTTSIELDGLVDEDIADVATMEIAMKYENDVELMLDSGPRGIIGSAVIDLTYSSAPVIIREGPVPLSE